MIAGIFHEGSGLGDQLFRYITVRTLAEKRGFDWGMANFYNFKGDFFPDWDDNGLYVHPSTGNVNHWYEKDVRDPQGNDIRSYDPEINFVEDNTIIDGSFEDDKYWRHNLDSISKWLAVEQLNVSDNWCVIGFRGGEYATQPDLFLGEDYYVEAIKLMCDKGIKNFEIHTDDPSLAKGFFLKVFTRVALKETEWEVIKNTPISHSKHSNMQFNWRSMRYAKYTIIPNSAFYILPRILKHYEDPTAVTIAPHYWARHNTKVWARPACYYPEFTYIHASDSEN